MRNAKLIFILLLPYLLTMSGCLAKGDFERICEVATEVESIEDPGLRVQEFYSRAEKVVRTRKAKMAISASPVAAPCQRYELMVAGAEYSRVHGWECPALERIFAAEIEEE